MRDERIYEMHDMNVKRVMILLRQFTFLNTRVQAFEDVLSTPSSILKAVFFPSWLKRVVDNRQMELMSIEDRKMEKAAARPVVLTNGR